MARRRIFPILKKENAKNELPAEAPIEIVTMVSKLQQSSTEDDTPMKKSTRLDFEAQRRLAADRQAPL